MSKNQQKAEALIKEYEKIITQQEKLLNEYSDKMKPFNEELQTKTKAIREAMLEDLNPLEVKRKLVESDIMQLGNKELDKLKEKKPSLFTDDNWKFEDSAFYLHIKRETEVKTTKDFELWRFIKKFEEYANVQYKIKELKKVFVDTKLAKPFIKLGMTLEQVPSVELKKSIKQ